MGHCLSNSCVLLYGTGAFHPGVQADPGAFPVGTGFAHQHPHLNSGIQQYPDLIRCHIGQRIGGLGRFTGEELVVAFRIARVGIKDDIAVDLAVGGVGGGEGSQHRTIDSSGAVGPGQGIGKVPQNVEGIAPGALG